MPTFDLERPHCFDKSVQMHFGWFAFALANFVHQLHQAATMMLAVRAAPCQAEHMIALVLVHSGVEKEHPGA